MKAEKTATRPALFRLQCVIKPVSSLDQGHIEASSVLYQHAKQAKLNCETDFFRTQEKAYWANSSAIPLIVSILYKLFISELFASKSISIRVQTILARLFLTLVTLLIHHSRISIHLPLHPVASVHTPLPTPRRTALLTVAQCVSHLLQASLPPAHATIKTDINNTEASFFSKNIW